MLIGTGDVRTWMSLPEGDKGPNDKLYDLCNAMQDFAESYTNRKLEAQLFKTHPDYCYLDGTGKAWIYAPVYPIWYITEACVDNDRAFGTATAIDSTDIFFYPDGRIITEGEYFTRGRRNVRLEYYAGYGTGSYPLPYDLKQVMIEMVVQSYKDGLTGIHVVQGVPGAGEAQFLKLFSNNTFWKETLGKYKRIGSLDYSYDDY